MARLVQLRLAVFHFDKEHSFGIAKQENAIPVLECVLSPQRASLTLDLIVDRALVVGKCRLAK